MSRPTILSFDQIQPAQVSWLWEPYLARGKLAILDGDPGTGKSFFVCDLAARLSRGGPLPDGKAVDEPIGTLLLNAEDNVQDTIWHRLEAAGAAKERVISLNGLGSGSNTPFTQFPRDLELFERVIRDHRIGFVSIDPMMAFFPPEVAANNDQCIRQALTPLADLASATGTCILLTRHLNKAGGPRAIYRGSGSIGIIGAIRTGLFLAVHPEEREKRLLAMSKTNIGLLGPSLEFRLTEVDPAGTAIEWLGESDFSANDLCAPPREAKPPRAREEAIEWLREFLATGPKKAKEVYEAGKQAGHSQKTLERAKQELGIKPEQVRRGGKSEWFWADPNARPPARPWDPNDPMSDLPPLPDLPIVSDDERAANSRMIRSKLEEWRQEDARKGGYRGPVGGRDRFNGEVPLPKPGSKPLHGPRPQ
jgi:hypothetical protein